MEFRARCVFRLSVLIAFLTAGLASATSVIPITDADLYQRSDIVAHGTVISVATEEGANGDPESVVVIRSLEVLKGGLATDLVLRQPGGRLPDGRFFQLWGRPEYRSGEEVVVFALALSDGAYTTAEMFLGRLEVKTDEKGTHFATSPLHGGAPEGVVVREDLRIRSGRTGREARLDSTSSPRPLGAFLDYLRNGARGAETFEQRPFGTLRSLRQPIVSDAIAPDWGPIGSLWRYNNGASAGWTLDGTANITGGGTGEATRALASWTNEPNSTINQFVGGTNAMHLSATTSPCGWSTCLSGGGVIGCAGPRGGGTNSWRGETWSTITGGEVWLRCYVTLNGFSSTITESVLLHEIGHTLGLGHSDQDVSTHDLCRGDESAATMRSSAQSRTTLGTDDSDAVRWLYGDGGNWCSSTCTAPTITTQPTSRTISSGQSTTLSVVAAGTTPLTYQWYVGLSGNTASPVAGGGGASLTISPTSTTSYWVRVSNACGSVNSSTATVTVTTGRRQKTPADFNGDRASELVVYRAGAWINFSGGPGVWTGQPSTNCIPTPGDYDGNGVTEFSLYCGGAWHFYNANGTYRKGIWTGGGAGDVPVPADYDGDGRDEVVIFRSGAWIAFDFSTGAQTWGVWTGPGGGVIPLPMDYDGDGRADFSVYSAGSWHFYNRNGTYLQGIWTGNDPSDIPVPGDYNGDGVEEPVIFRGGSWQIYSFATRSITGGVWTGAASFNGDPLQPAPLDFDGDGSMDFTVFAGGPWHTFQDSGAYRSGVWTGGVRGDRAVSRKQRVIP